MFHLHITRNISTSSYLFILLIRWIRFCNNLQDILVNNRNLLNIETILNMYIFSSVFTLLICKIKTQLTLIRFFLSVFKEQRNV